MPKLNHRPPKYCKLNNYAVVYHHGKPHYLGAYGSPESQIAYSRVIAEIQANPTVFQPSKEKNATISELGAAFLDHAKANMTLVNYSFYRIIVLDFLVKLYGDGICADDFAPKCLKLVRTEMIQSGRFCRKIVNRSIKSIITIFAWGVENDLVQETTWRALKSVASLPKGYPGTFDNDGREPVPDEVIRRTLPFMPPTLQAMVQLQRILGMRPNEIFKMRVGDIDSTRGNDLWYYTPDSYKTSKFIGKIVFPLGKPEQDLIAPYLEGKKPEQAVFSPRKAMQERNAEKRANRKTKISPSQAARNKARAAKPSRYSEFYNRDSYRQAIKHAIAKGNKSLSDGEKIPNWYPYLLRHAAATITELEHSDTDAQALLGHQSVNMTKRYSKAQLARREELARNRRNPFETMDEES